MILIWVALLCQVPPAEVDSLIRDLGHDLPEVRERAHRRLLDVDESALPALLAAAESGDAEIRFRAVAVLEVVGRIARERVHDADQLAALLKADRTPEAIEAERQPGSGATKGARFDMNATPFDGGWIISAKATNYLARRLSEGQGRGRFRFDVREVACADGRALAVERCSRCSPAKVYVRAAAGPLNVRLTGSQVWFSRYRLEFQNPWNGERKRVGAFTIEMAWPVLRVTSERAFPEEWIPSIGGTFTCTLKQGLALRGVSSNGYDRCGCGGRWACGAKKKHWCDCPNGPQPVVAPVATVQVDQFSAFRDRSEDTPVFYPEAFDDIVNVNDLALEHVTTITCFFWKPIEIPIDLTVVVPAK